MIYRNNKLTIYNFDISRKKRGRPSKNINNKIVLSEHINVDNITWKYVYKYKNNKIIKYWRYHITNNNTVII